MRLKHLYLAATATTVMAAVVTGSPAHAQDAAAPTTADKTTDDGQGEIVVTGVRASLLSAQLRKKNASQIVDSIVAEDIGKLPDQNTTDALQRVTGVQIERDYGEGSSVYVRGLSQVETTLNGREVFTAQGVRGLNFQDVPAELLGGIDVYKSPSANLIEGGLGGLIDLRTRRPLDFKKLTISATAKGLYSDLIHRLTPNVSGLIADKWNTGAGEMGVLLSVSYQQRKFRSDLISTGAPATSTTVIPGKTVIAPSGAYDVTPAGDRRRFGVDAMFQWRPSPNLDLYAEAHYAKFDNVNDTYGASVSLGGLTAEPGATLFSGTNDVATATYLNAPLSVLAYTYDTHDKTTQFATGGTWRNGRLTLSTDISYTKSTGTVGFDSAFLGATIPRFTQDLTAPVPASNVNGYDLLSGANNTIQFLLYQGFDNRADQFAGRFDGSYDLGDSFLKSIDFGFRYADRSAKSNQPSFFLYSGASAATVQSIVAPNPFNDFFDKVAADTPLLRNYLVVPVPLLRDHRASVQTALGFSTTNPTPGALTYYDVDEKTTALYIKANFGDSNSLVDGNIGVRYVHTAENLSGNQTLPGGGTGPIAVNSKYDDWLPSVNVRFNFTDKLKLRLAASKAVTRPNFSDLSPGLTLNLGSQQGSSGNPFLKPLKADQLDASLEYYFSNKGSIYGAFFYKKVKNFLSTTVSLETYGGVTYNVTRPTNNQGGTIKGLEVGYQQFFDFLPGPLSGLGVQANYTYIDSATTSSIVGQVTPLQGLSKNTYNIVGIYEKYGLSARVAYNWRSTYFDSTYSLNGVTQPSYRRGYGWLDASLSYDVTPSVTISLEGSNLLRAVRRSYYNDLTSRPHETQIDDRQILFGVRFTL